MSLSPKALEEYKKIYKEETGKDISDEEAWNQASNLLQAFKAVYRPIPRDMWEKYKQEHPELTEEEIKKIEGIQ